MSAYPTVAVTLLHHGAPGEDSGFIVSMKLGPYMLCGAAEQLQIGQFSRAEAEERLSALREAAEVCSLNRRLPALSVVPCLADGGRSGWAVSIDISPDCLDILCVEKVAGVLGLRLFSSDKLAAAHASEIAALLSPDIDWGSARIGV